MKKIKKNIDKHKKMIIIIYVIKQRKEQMKMKLTTYCINKGQKTQYFGLKNAEENTVLYYAPNNWKTEKGALNWAKKHGYEIA